MFQYILKRLMQAIPLLIGVSIIGFSMMHLAPGGPLAVYTLNPTITAQDIERIKTAGMATGYRFRVTAANVEGNDLRLQVTNDGVAPIYRDAFFAAGAKRSFTSLRGLLPGEKLECQIKGVTEEDLQQITIQSDAILPTQTIQFDANLN